MREFRFAIMGAGHIARKFCDAAALVDGCAVCAVSSKSMDRARALAGEKDIPAAYDSYEEMLRREKPDCVYIAESGVKGPEDVALLKGIGADAALIGEALMRSPDPAETLRLFRG